MYLDQYVGQAFSLPTESISSLERLLHIKRLRRGQSLMEYVLILTLVSTAVVGALTLFGARVAQDINGLAQQVISL